MVYLFVATASLNTAMSLFYGSTYFSDYST